MRRCLKLIVALALAHGATAMAAESMEDVKSTVEALQATIKAQQARLDQLEAKMDMDMRTEMAKVARELAADADQHAAVPSWLDNLKFYGDLRLRYQNDFQSGSGRARRPKLRNRARYRLRFGFIKTWLDEQLEVGFRLTSGDNAGAPTSTNETMGDGFFRDDIRIDRAYAIYRPNAIKGLTIAGGKVANPLVHTDLVWDEDVNPEGFWAQYKFKAGPAEPFANVGYFIVQENAGGLQQLDAILMSYQVGNTWTITDDINWQVAVTYYDYDHTKQLGWVTRGGYEMVNLTHKVRWKMFKLPWCAYFDLVHNCEDDYPGGTDDGEADDGFAIGVQVGENEKKGDWSLAYKYARIERFCTPPLNDADFNFTNVQGHSIGAKYNLTDFLTVGAKVFVLRHIIAPIEDQNEITTQVDIAWKF